MFWTVDECEVSTAWRGGGDGAGGSWAAHPRVLTNIDFTASGRGTRVEVEANKGRTCPNTPSLARQHPRAPQQHTRGPFANTFSPISCKTPSTGNSNTTPHHHAATPSTDTIIHQPPECACACACMGNINFVVSR